MAIAGQQGGYLSDLRARAPFKPLLAGAFLAGAGMGVLLVGVLLVGVLLVGVLLQLLVLRWAEALPRLLFSVPLSPSLSEVWSMSLLALCTGSLEGPGPAPAGACVKVSLRLH